MSLDNGLTDIQPDSHSIVLSCIEGLEEFVRGFRREAAAHIFHAKTHPIQPLSFGSNEQLPRAIIYWRWSGSPKHRKPYVQALLD